jgi:erythronate-4-phosphate dehydrogenase
VISPFRNKPPAITPACCRSALANGQHDQYFTTPRIGHPGFLPGMLIVADSKIPYAEVAFAPFGEVQVVPTEYMTSTAIRKAEVILIRSETKANAALLNGTSVRFVGTATIGTDHVDVDYLKQHNIGFASCPGSNANSVAEYVLAALLEVSYRLGFSLHGKTLGIVGHGNTGSRVAQKAEALGMTVLLNDPPLARSTGDLRYLPLDALMEADVVSLHVPLTTKGEDATFHLFDERRLSAMKEGSILINSSRGAVVDTKALKNALHAKHLRACVLDVWENEPQIDPDLLRLATIGTPHIAGYSFDGKLNATRMLRDALAAFVGVPLPTNHPWEKVERKAIRVRQDAESAESSLRCAVRACYAIDRDDDRLRRIFDLEHAKQPDFFRALRASYPERREFHNYMIDDDRFTPEFARMLSSVGFIVQPSPINHTA